MYVRTYVRTYVCMYVCMYVKRYFIIILNIFFRCTINTNGVISLRELKGFVFSKTISIIDY